jgi:hypothetical protein
MWGGPHQRTLKGTGKVFVFWLRLRDGDTAVVQSMHSNSGPLITRSSTDPPLLSLLKHAFSRIRARNACLFRIQRRADGPNIAAAVPA